MAVWREPIRVNAMKVQFVLLIMDAAITSCKSALLCTDVKAAESSIPIAKKAYGNALRFASRISFDVRQVSAFESRSIRLEGIISKLEAEYNSWKRLS